MSAEIHPAPSTSETFKKLELSAKLEGHQDVVTKALALKNEDGVISVSDDKTIMIWLKRGAGHYWPSVCHKLPAAGKSLDYNYQTSRLFVGMENGLITEFHVADDYNKLTFQKNYISHSDQVNGLLFSLPSEWLLSVSRDKFFCWYCAETARRIGGYLCGSCCTAVQFDVQSKHTFIGDSTGQITMIKLEDNGYKPITTFKGHTDAVRCLAWSPERQMLFSGSYDKMIICWDIGGKRGTAYELQGHNGRVTSLYYANQGKFMVSASEDCKVVFWRMDVKRKETPNWLESDFCQKCSKPFFWNIKAMLDQRVIGLRQHHCRKCGKAVCDGCSSNKSNIPIMGFENQVRVCNSCKSSLTEEELVSLATSYDASRHSIMHMDMDEERQILVTAGTDRMIKIWDISNILNPSE